MSIPNFHHDSTVISQVTFSRKPNVPETITVQLNIQIKIVDNANLPQRLQVNLRAQTNDIEDINFQLEAIGLFDYVNPDTAPTKQEKLDFVRERGLYIVWQSIAHMARLITAEMGISPLNLRTPDIFITDQLEQNYLAGAQSTSD